MSDRRARLRVTVQILSPLVGMGLLAAVLLWATETFNDSAGKLGRTDSALMELHALDALITTQSAAVSAYLASGSEESLAVYRDTAPIDASVAKLQDLVSDNAGQRLRIDSLREKYDAWRRVTDNDVSHVLAGAERGAISRSGGAAERAVHEVIGLTETVERQLQKERAESLAAARRLLLLIPVGGLVLAIGLSAIGTMQLSSLAAESAAQYQRLADQHANARHEHGLVRAEVEQLRQLVQERTGNLKAVTNQLEALTYAVSRHLRGGLAQADTLLRDVWYESLGGPVDREALGRLALEVSSAQRLLEALLTCARLTRIDLSIDRIGLGDVVESAVEDLRTEINRVQAQVTIAPSLPAVQGNRAVLVQVFSHLLSNALMFRTEEPKIRIWAHSTEGTVRIWVEDNGIGIAPKDHDRIFTLFERVQSDANGQGVGVGLAIVRLAVERLGGRTGVEAVLGQGSSFWIELPVAT